MRTADVIGRIRQILADGNQSAAQDGSAVAEAYARLCRQTNERLRGCGDYLKKEMVSEALRIAESEPALLDLCGELDFVGVEKWTGLCAQKKWPVAESIDAKAVQFLNDAYASGQALEPLLKEYRRAVMNRNTRECVRLLRNIADIDKNTLHWIEDLKGFEQRRFGEIRTEFEKARQNEDVNTLAALMVEINAKWSIPRDNKIRDEVRDTAHAIYNKLSLAKGHELLAEISAAYAALDFNRMESVIGKYQILLGEGYLKPDEKMKTQFEEAREWFQQEKKTRDDKRLCVETLTRLRDAVEQGVAEPLDEILNILARFNEPIPDRLEERAHAIIDAYQLARDRVRRRWMVITAIAVLLFASCIAVVMSHFRFQSAKRQYQENIARAYQSNELDNCKSWLSKAKREHPRVFRDPAIQAWERKTAELETLIEKKREALAQALSQLTAVRENHFQQAPNVVEVLIAEAKSNMISGAAEGQLSVFLSEWEAHKQAFQIETDRQASDQIAKIDSAVEALARTINQKTDFEKKQLLNLQQQTEDLNRSFKNASPDLQARITTLIARVNALIKEIESQEQQRETIRAARTFSDYLSAIKIYSKAFPNDGISRSLHKTLLRESDYIHIIEPVTGCVSNNPFWYGPYREREELLVRLQEKWPEVKTQLLDLDKDKRFTDIYKYESSKGVWFLEGKASQGVKDGIQQYRGMLYYTKSNENQPAFKDNPIPFNLIEEFSLMPHCNFVNGLVSMARFSKAPNAGNDIMNKMEELYVINGISPLLKLRLIDMLVGCLTILVGEDHLPGWDSLRKDLKSIDPDLHWLCVQHRDVKQANKEAEIILNRYFTGESLIRQTSFLTDARDISLSRFVKWAGYVDLTNTLSVVWKDSAHPQEVWVVREGDGGGPSIFMAAELGTNDTVQMKYGKYISGEPIFAPSDGKTTREHLIMLMKKHKLRETKNLKWPNSWPVNLRQ